MTAANNNNGGDPPIVLRGPLDGADCGSCPFARDGKPRNPVKGIGPEAPAMIFIGEGPGQQESLRGIPFIGPSGELVNKALAETGTARNRIWIGNVTSCQPTKNDEKLKHAAAVACRGRLLNELAMFPGLPVLALGGVAARSLVGELTDLPITEIAGSHFEADVDGTGIRSIIPTVHPAAILRSSREADTGPEKTGSHVADLAFWSLKWDVLKIRALAEGRDIHLRMRLDEEIFVELAKGPRANSLVTECLVAAKRSKRLTIDYETYVDDPERNFALQAFVAKIRLIGLASEGWACSVLWDLLSEDTVAAYAAALADVEITKEYHNLGYDTAVSQNQWYRFKLAGPTEDTMLGQHAAWPGAKKKLQHVVGQYRAVEPWKCLRGDVKVLLPDRSTMEIREVVRKQIPAVLSFDGDQIVTKRVVGWHGVHVPDQAWLRIRTDQCDLKYSRGLIVTPDHKVMTDRGLIEARNLQSGRDRILIDEPRFSDDQIAASLGTLLGDSTLHVSRSYHQRPWEAKRASIRGGHANQGLRDCKVAALPLGTACQRVPAHNKRAKDGTPYKASDFYAYGTKWAFQYSVIANLVYDDQWKRRIKMAGLRCLGRRGLAMMYMDDGDLHKPKKSTFRPAAGFSTHGFPLDDVDLFAEWLRSQYGQVSVHKSRYCALSVAATTNMLEDLRGYIHPSVRYKTTFDDAYVDVSCGNGAHSLLVTSVEKVSCDQSTPGNRYLNDHRYCLTVEDTKLFYTNYGLVSNSEFRDSGDSLEDEAIYNAKDALGTHETIRPTHFWVKKNQAEKVYEVDKIKAAFGAEMHLRGYFVDPEVNGEIKRRLQTVINEADGVMQAAYTENQPRVLAQLAREQAKMQRKADPASYADRIRIREAELAERIVKGKFDFSPSNDWHAIAFLKARGVPLWQTTSSGRTSTAAAVLEKVSHYPEVDELLRLRSNDQLLETFVIRMFEWVWDKNKKKWRAPHVQDDGRCHPIWSGTQISGRYSSKDPASSNWSLGDETHKDPRKRLPNTRRQLTAPPGRIIVAFDKAQLELRLITVQSGDPFLCKILAEDKDPHHEFGVIVFPRMLQLDVKSEEYQKLRDLTKRFEYGGIYGGADAVVHRAVCVDEPALAGVNGLKMVGAAIAKMKAAIPGVFAWQQRLLRETSLPPYTLRSYLLGRRRVFPLGNPPPTDIANNPNQFAGADVMDVGLAKLMPRLAKYGGSVWPLLHQHDAIYFECNEDDGMKLAKDIDESFYMEIPAVNGQVIPFPNEIKIGYAYHSEPSDKQKALFPELIWPVGRPGLKKVKV